MKYSKALKVLTNAFFTSLVLTVGQAAAAKEAAFEIEGQVTDVEQLKTQEQDKFYQIDNNRYELIFGMAKEAYLDNFFKKIAAEKKTSLEQARKDYLKAHGSYTEAEYKKTFEQYKNHPSLKDLPEKEKESQIRSFLSARGEQEVNDKIVEDALNSKKLVIKVEKPQEPVYEIVVTEKDHVRYGPKNTDVNPLGCKGDSCAITVVEYSEFECPFCSKVLPTTHQLLTEYQGKVRWIVRDFPLSFHPRARPAAIAAKCASFQGPSKYWDMYQKLFDNQRALGDNDLEGYAKAIGLDMNKYNQCIKSPAEANELINKHLASASKEGVSGTPAFFINGRRVSGALPYADFKRMFDEELAKGKKT